ncbi:MAG TPA: hypothetical protein VNR87_03480 [Flavisolibacter sp.]|nr:hypothetical protein [Flavisolibacter sp.]
MSKSIKTYDDLLQEEQRLLQVLRSQETLIREDLAGLKESLKPVAKVYNVLNRMATRDHTGPLANFGIDFGIDLVIRKLLLARAGWFTKIFVPFIVKNYSSHIISDEQRAKFAQKIQNIFNKIRPKKDREASAKFS